MLATPVLFRLEGRLLGLRHRGRDSFTTNLYLPEKKPKAYGGQNSQYPASRPKRMFAKSRENESADCRS